MAATTASEGSLSTSAGDFSLSSFQTAIAVIPPAFLHPRINSLRSLYDKSYKKWPPHINILYPFVAPEYLVPAVQQIRDLLGDAGEEGEEKKERVLGFWLKLDQPGYFTHRQNATVFLSPGPHHATVDRPETESGRALRRLEGLLSELFSKGKGGAGIGHGGFRPHLTVGQTSLDRTVMGSLVSKAGKLVGSGNRDLGWFASRLAVLKRDEDGEMRIVDEIILGRGEQGEEGKGEEEEAIEGLGGLDLKDVFGNNGTEGSRNSFRFSIESGDWVPIAVDPTTGVAAAAAAGPPRFPRPKEVTVATYNTLVDSPTPPPIERYPLLVRAILSVHSSPTTTPTTTPTTSPASPSILCLQEVTDEFLSYLLSNDAIRVRYPLCTHSPASVLPSIRNCVILATEACGPFEWRWLDFAKHHKGAVVASFPKLGRGGGGGGGGGEQGGGPLVVAAVHLTCGLSDGGVAAKASQLKALTTYLQTVHPNDEWIVAGDFNLQTSKQAITSALANKAISRETCEQIQAGLIDEEVFSDAWELCFGEGEQDNVGYEAEDCDVAWGASKGDGESGATFNPLTNPLAAERVQWSLDPRPQRYDRVLTKRSGSLRARDVRRFGFPKVNSDGHDTTPGPVCGSDHWGVKAVFDAHLGSKGALPLAGQDSKLKLPLRQADISDQLLKTFVEASIPTPSDDRVREDAIKILKEVLEREQETTVTTHASRGTHSRGSFPIILAPIGSYALGVYSKGSDVDCLCVSTISSKTFFQVARQRIKKFGAGHGVRAIRFVDAKIPVLELKVGNIKFDLQYCQVPTVMVEHWSDIPLLPPSDPVFSLPASNLKCLNAYRDVEFLLRTIPNLKAFRLAHRFIKSWTVTSGISSSRFGYLGGFHITLLLARICKLLVGVGQKDAGIGAITAGAIVSLFFDYYSKANWAKNGIFDPGLPPVTGTQYQRLARESMVIASIHSPVVNVAVNATRHSVAALAKEFKLADEALKSGQWDLAALRREEGFLKDFASFVKIDVQYWGNSLGRGKALATWVESRVPLLLVELNKKTPSVFARVWPQRFVNTFESDQWTELRGFYLVGLSSDETHPDSKRSKDEKREVENKFVQVLRNFEQQLREDPLRYDQNVSWVQVQHVSGSALGTVKVDDRDWGGDGDDGNEGVDSDSDSDSDEDFLQPGEFSDGDFPAKRPKQQKGKPQTPAKKKKSIPGRKLRPALDVLNRIRWDSSLEAGEFVVGYEDRFLGVKEMEVKKWKVEQTDLEFIPLHRVVYFKRVDGVLVWDRETKTDLVFGVAAGSGAGSGA